MCGRERRTIFKIAKLVKDAGAKILRGGAFKTAFFTYSFQGLGEDGLKLLRAAANEFQLKVVTEVMDKSQIDLVEKYADILQIGAPEQCRTTHS